MVKSIMRDVLFLSQKSETADKNDLYICDDLRDTLRVHADGCVGMAANMIGYRKNIIIVSLGFTDLVLINPAIIMKEKPYEAEEGCLSLTGVRKATRYQTIIVRYQDEAFWEHTQEFSGYTAQIIQHECDHLAGIVI